jgi:hypothetical protein
MPRIETRAPSDTVVMIDAPVLGPVLQRKPAPPVPETTAKPSVPGVTATVATGGGYGWGFAGWVGRVTREPPR